MHTLHIFCCFCLLHIARGRQKSHRNPKYPQTHNLWITFAVECQTPPFSAHFGSRQNIIHRIFHTARKNSSNLAPVNRDEYSIRMVVVKKSCSAASAKVAGKAWWEKSGGWGEIVPFRLGCAGSTVFSFVDVRAVSRIQRILERRVRIGSPFGRAGIALAMTERACAVARSRGFTPVPHQGLRGPGPRKGHSPLNPFFCPLGGCL